MRSPRAPRLLLLDWRRLIIYTHRWLGIAGCLLFVAWFASGIVMMYARMPILSAEERLARLGGLDLATARVSPAAIVEREQLAPTGIRIAMLRGRPVYRMALGQREATAFGDTGELLNPVGPDEAVAIARDFFPEHTETIAYGSRLLDSDQWTLSSTVRSLMPLHRIDIGDPAGSELYVAESTGEPVLKTTHNGRVWGYLGAVIHWIYFTPLRRQATLWAQSIIWVSIAGCVMCLTGLVWGVWRFSPVGRFRLKRQLSHSPYAGMMLWHHYAGLAFGVTTFTWILSGLLSMDPWDWHPGTAPTTTARSSQRRTAAHGPADCRTASDRRRRIVILVRPEGGRASAVRRRLVPRRVSSAGRWQRLRLGRDGPGGAPLAADAGTANRRAVGARAKSVQQIFECSSHNRRPHRHTRAPHCRGIMARSVRRVLLRSTWRAATSRAAPSVRRRQQHLALFRSVPRVRRAEGRTVDAPESVAVSRTPQPRLFFSVPPPAALGCRRHRSEHRRHRLERDHNCASAAALPPTFSPDSPARGFARSGRSTQRPNRTRQIAGELSAAAAMTVEIAPA